MCALYQGDGVTDLAAACRRVGTDLGELVATEAKGLINIEEQGIAFEHPLLRGAVARGAALEQAAVEALGRGGFASAARALHRAARLSTNGAAVTRRLLDAGRAAAGAGQPVWSLAVLDEAATHATDAATGTTIQHLRGVCLLWSGKVNEATALLTAVAEQPVASDPIAAATVIADAATARVGHVGVPPRGSAGRTRAGARGDRG